MSLFISDIDDDLGLGLGLGLGLLVSSSKASIIAGEWASRVVANGGTVSSSTLAAVKNFIQDCIAAGVWEKLVRINLFCGDWLAALVPLKTGGGFDTDVRSTGDAEFFARSEMQNAKYT
jgi:hypothetical protein